MSSFHTQQSSGAPTFTAASASLSLSGLDHHDFSPLVDVDPNLLDSAEWFNGQDAYHSAHAQQPLSPGHEHFAQSPNFAYASHGVPVSSEAFRGSQYPTLNHSMNGHSISHFPHDHGAPRLDDLQAISPLQTSYHPNAYQTPYPDSTASSAPSEDPVIADADEDKRKRNQAASARFRQKKKQREQQMMEQSRDMQERTKKLEGEVESLKRENTFLKKLLVEKVDNMSDDDKAMLVKTTKDVVNGK